MAQKPLEEIAWMKRLHFFWGAVPRDSKTHLNALHQPSRCQVQHQQNQNCWEAPRNTLIYWANRIWGTSGICLSGCSWDYFGDSPTPKRKRVPQTRPENGANLGWSVRKFRPVGLSLGKQLITVRHKSIQIFSFCWSYHIEPSSRFFKPFPPPPPELPASVVLLKVQAIASPFSPSKDIGHMPRPSRTPKRQQAQSRAVAP